MIHLRLPPTDQPQDFNGARAKALARAHSLNMAEPVVLAWRRLDTTGGDAKSDARWAAYGIHHGGEADIRVGRDFEFIVMDSEGFEAANTLPLLANLKDAQGTEYLCLTPMLGKDAQPGAAACQPLDEWTADQL